MGSRRGRSDCCPTIPLGLYGSRRTKKHSRLPSAHSGVVSDHCCGGGTATWFHNSRRGWLSVSTTDFARLLTRYLSQHLLAQRNLSSRTIESYRDTFKLLLRFGHEERGWKFEYITLSQIDRACIEEFLDLLEATRHSSVATRNQRL